MKCAIGFVCFLIATFAAGATIAATAVEKDLHQVPIIALESNVEHDGKFHYHYESGDGTKASEDGHLKAVDPEHAGEAVQGEFSYVGDDGQSYNIQYTADENGFVPQGAHIPTSPPIPEAIARALKYLATAPPPKENQ